MSRKHYSPEQIIYKLREAEVLISQGMKTPEAARQVCIVEQTCYRWGKEYDWMRVIIRLNVSRFLRRRMFD